MAKYDDPTRPSLSQKEAAELAERLLHWYEREKRDLPWRRTRDPYKIWVSEVMLQQTRVETVIPYWERFVAQFPTPEALARAKEEDVLKAWEGLGYYSRARNLQAAVREVVEKYGGRVPNSLEEISALPGVGEYTAGAILSIAYDRDVAAVDGNVLRVLARLFLISEAVTKQRVRKRLTALAEGMIPPGRASFFNQAMMDLGATVCLPKNPRCFQCPWQEKCKAHAEGVEEELPVKEKKKPSRSVELVTGIVRHGERVLLVRRPAQGLLAGMWEFPGCERDSATVLGDEEILLAFLARLGQEVAVGPFFAEVEHTFSHIRWQIRAYECQAREPLLAEGEAVRWISLNTRPSLALPAAHIKLFQALGGLV